MDSDVGYLRIATEEAFAPPELVSMWQTMLADGTVDDPGFVSLQGFFMLSTAPRPAAILARLQDLGERRIADMDAAGIDRQVISLTCPGTQILDRDRAVAMATLANDQLAEACRRHPDRFSGLTAVAPQDPEGAAAEIGARRARPRLQGRHHQLAHPGRVPGQPQVLADPRGRRGPGHARLPAPEHPAQVHDRPAP